MNTRDGSLSAPMSVIVDGGKIQRITQIRGINASGTGQVIGATGKYLVPGYNDMHTHAMVAVDHSPPYWPLFIANGVTGIREMGGSAAAIQRARKLNADAAAGLVDAPEVLQIPGDILGGQSPTAAGAIAFVQAQKANGADFFKLTGGAPPAILAILAEAKNRGLDVAGHFTPGVSATDAWRSARRWRRRSSRTGHGRCRRSSACARRTGATISSIVPIPTSSTSSRLGARCGSSSARRPRRHFRRRSWPRCTIITRNSSR